MKTFKEFVNESITQYLQPKSDEEMIKVLGKFSKQRRIKEIIERQFPYELLPRNVFGRCVYRTDFRYTFHDYLTILTLPENFTIKGDLNVNNIELKELPKGLRVKEDIVCFSNKLTTIPDDLIFNGQLYLYNNKITYLPDNLIVNGDLDVSWNHLTELPKGLIVKGDLTCYDNVVKLELPKDTKIKGKFIN